MKCKGSARQLELADWPTAAGGCVVEAALLLCVILDEKSYNSSAAGCLIDRQILRLDTEQPAH